MREPAWIAVIGLLAAFLGVWLVVAGNAIRRRHGLSGGKTVALDNVTLTSQRLKLTGKPDRIIRSGGTLVIEDWKSARKVQPWHRAQMGVYFLLAEDQLGVRPSHGVLVTGDGRRHQIENNESLRAWVLGIAETIRQRRADVNQPIPVNPAPWQCRPCGQRGNCGQAKNLSSRNRLQGG